MPGPGGAGEGRAVEAPVDRGRHGLGARGDRRRQLDERRLERLAGDERPDELGHVVVGVSDAEPQRDETLDAEVVERSAATST